MFQEQLSLSRRIFVLAVLLGVGSWGCGGDEQAAPGPPPRLELGGGRVDFEPLPSGGSIEVISGPQGGFHLELTARLFDLDPNGVALDYKVRDAESMVILSIPAKYAIGADRVIDHGDHLLRVGDRAVLSVASAEDAAGRTVVLTCSAQREGNTIAEDSREVTIVDQIDEIGL